jgi:hypothetical protein
VFALFFFYDKKLVLQGALSLIGCGVFHRETQQEGESHGFFKAGSVNVFAPLP